MSRMYSIYMHIFPNGKRYIGITSQNPTSRWRKGKGYIGCPKMNRAIQKFGWDNIEHIVLYENLPKGLAEAMEIQMIAEYNTIENGYNIEKGGNVLGSHSEETRRKIGEANRRRVFTEETRREQSKFMMGNQYNKGNHHTEEFKRMKSQQMHEKYKDGGNPRCKKVQMIKPNGSIELFYSLRKAAEVANVCPSSMHKYIHEEKIINGCQWRYV